MTPEKLADLLVEALYAYDENLDIRQDGGGVVSVWAGGAGRLFTGIQADPALAAEEFTVTVTRSRQEV